MRSCGLILADRIIGEIAGERNLAAQTIARRLSSVAPQPLLEKQTPQFQGPELSAILVRPFAMIIIQVLGEINVFNFLAEPAFTEKEQRVAVVFIGIHQHDARFLLHE